MKKFLTLIALLMAFAANGFADTWTVAGNSEDLFGSSWNTGADAGNDMTYDSDSKLWIWTKSGVTLTGGSIYEFKVVKNHAWDENYPASNYKFSVGTTGEYTITITFDAESESKDIKVIIPGAGNTYTVAGAPASLFGTAWAPTETANDMVETSEGSGIYTWTKENVELDGNAIEFKICQNHGWDIAYPDDNYVVSTEDGYDGAGTYNVTITFTEETKDVTAEFVKQVKTYTYYFVDGEGWGDNEGIVKAFAWTNTSGTVTAPWPGDATELQTEKYNGYNVYKFSSTTKPDFIIFNNGKDGDDKKQTADLPFYDGGTFKNVLEAYALFAKVGTGEWTYNQAVPLTAAVSGYFVFTIGGNAANTEFIIAPSNAIDQNDATNPTIVDWNKLIRPVTNGENWLVENHKDYTGATSALSPSSWILSSDFTGTEVYLAYSPIALAQGSNGTFLIANGDDMDKATITSAGWATYSNAAPYAIYGENLEVYIVTTANGSSAKLTKLNPTVNSLLPAGVVQLPAGTGILIKGNAGDYSVCPSFDKAELGMQDVTGNLLIGSGNTTYYISGKIGDTSYTPYIFMNDPTDGVGFYKLDVTTASDEYKTLAAHKAFLAAPAGMAAPFLAIDGEATGIQNIERTLNDGLFYDLSGRRVENPTKGLYIHNGKKVVIK